MFNFAIFDTPRKLDAREKSVLYSNDNVSSGMLKCYSAEILDAVIAFIGRCSRHSVIVANSSHIADELSLSQWKTCTSALLHKCAAA